MKFHFIAFLVAIFPFHFYAQKDFNPQDFPSFKSVEEHFYENYNALEDGGLLYFEKRPEGYFVAMALEYSYEVRKKREMLWSYETRSFQKLKSYFSGSADIKNLRRVRNSTSNTHEFNFCAFAGYPGWQLDVVEYFGEKENLPDTLLYGLARAYTTHATNLISNRGGNIDKEKQFDLPKGNNSLTPEQLKTYREYFHAGHATFKKLSEQNPNFETIVGKIYIKYCNEVMNTFLQLLYFQNEEEARKELKHNLYDEFYINAAKNYLNSCPPNTILFTYGDNDTYPLLYVQAQLGFRTDVLLVNTSLLKLDRYIDHLRKGVFDAAAYPLPFDASFYKDDKNIQVFTNLPGDKKENSSLDEAIKFIKNEENRFSTGNQRIASLPSKTLFIEINKKAIIKKNIVPISQRENIVDTIKWTIPQGYILKNDLALLGLITENNWKRPICIGATCRKSIFLGMEDYFHLEGLAYRFYPVKKNQETTYLMGGINVDESFKKVTKDFTWEGIDKIESGKKVYFSSYLILFTQLSNQLIIQGKNEKAEQILDLFIKIFPNEVIEYNYSFELIADLYFQLEEIEKAKAIVIQIAENFAEIENPSSWNINTFYRFKSQSHKYNSQKLNRILEKISW